MAVGVITGGRTEGSLFWGRMIGKIVVWLSDHLQVFGKTQSFVPLDFMFIPDTGEFINKNHLYWNNLVTTE